MLTYVVGSLFESPAHTLVNTVNTDGVMGKGIAKRFKTIYPKMFKEYQRLCEREQFTVGQLWLHKTPNKWVLNFPTKTTWRKPSKVEYIKQGLKTFADTYSDRGITSIAFPLLGCGNGELEWEMQVQPLMEEHLADLPIQVYIHTYQTDPSEKPEHRKIREINRWVEVGTPIVAFFGGVARPEGNIGGWSGSNHRGQRRQISGIFGGGNHSGHSDSSAGGDPFHLARAFGSSVGRSPIGEICRRRDSPAGPGRNNAVSTGPVRTA